MKRRVFVGLSGGVDSSVSAALLQKAGYEVIGVFICVWQPDFFDCGWKDDRLDAMRVCAKLGIPFRELNLENEYKKEVVDAMVREYRAGRTPNPDVSCNRFIKFGGFYDWAQTQGADFIATGHYARVVGGRLLVGADNAKDQSYFLWQIRKEQLPHILFPIGEMKKPEVRILAKKFQLITADKKDSQGLCFIGKVDIKKFLARYIKPKKGKVVNESGEVVGEHTGAAFFTIGERLAGGYVVAKDMKRNTLTISEKNAAGELAETRREVEIRDCNWGSASSADRSEVPKAEKVYSARLRYRQPFQSCKIPFTYGRTQIVHFERPQIAAAGQSLVLYDDEVCLGGGIIV